MKINKSILNKIFRLSIVAWFFSSQNKNNIITEKELFVSLIYLFSKSYNIKNMFLEFWLDLDRVLVALYNKYIFPENLNLDVWTLQLSFSQNIYDMLINMPELENEYFFPILLFSKLLSLESIINFLKENNIDDLFVMLDFKSLLDSIYSNNKIKEEMKKIFTLQHLVEKKEKNDIELFLNWTDDFSDFDVDFDDFDEYEEDKSTNTDTNNKNNDNPKLVLDAFWTNLTFLASEQKLEPVVWREKEIKEVIYTLLRKTKNNPLLVWEAWVGKTAIVEWLAQKIVKSEVPEKLRNKQIYMLDMWSLVAWTKYRWEFEARLKQIIQEASNPENNIILFIDEIHTIVWAWNMEWSADTANLIKPYLARWEITLIWATTFNEYQKYIEKDPALTRRFQLIKIDEPSEEEAIDLLNWIKYRFEDFHWVNISKEAVQKAVNLSKRYILDRYLPDKAIDLLDEASARKSTSSLSSKTKLKIGKLEKEIAKIEWKIKKAIENQDYFAAANYKYDIKEKKEKIYKLKSANDIPKKLRPTLKWDDIEKVIAEKYWISSKVLWQSELDFLINLESLLNKEIIWQEEAVKEVVSALTRNKLSPLERNKPIWTFLFLWPSWVGKTYLAQLLAKYFFQNENFLIKINMSEYTESISSSKLIWASAWYVWYEEWGILTEAVRKKPYSVVLFDEIEKWSSKVLNILLQILDQWYLEDNKWRKIDFKNTIVILTSNIWLEYFNKEITKVWFETNNENSKWLSEEKKEIILSEVKNLLPLELINRLDKIVFFNQINDSLLEKVFNKYYKEYRKLWKSKKWITVPNLTKDEIKKIVENIKKEWSGVRWIEKYIYNELENKVVKNILLSLKK